jgi:hypothetical protein
MAFNPRRPHTRDSYRQELQTVAWETMNGLRTPAIGGKVLLPHWWVNGEIRVFSDPAVPQATVDLITAAVSERIRETTGFTFTFHHYGDHPSAREQVAQATSSRGLDPDRLFALSLSEGWRNEARGGRQHGDIYITTKPFLDDQISWGAACFRHGTMMFALHSGRSSSSGFLRRVALHETNHLLGMYCHCDDYQVVRGHQYTPSCNMHYSCPSDTLCPKCVDFIHHWWLQVAHEYELQQGQGLASG